MPKLSGVVDSLEGVPEQYKGAYEEKEGKFYLKEIEFEDVAPFKEKLTKKERLLTDANQKLGRYTKFQDFTDEDLDQLVELRELKRQGKPLTVDEKAELERLHKKSLEKITSELHAEREGRKADQAQLKHFRLTVPLRDIAIKAGVIADDLDLVMLDVQSRFSLDDNGKIVVLDDDGDPTDVTPQKFFETLYKQHRPKFYKASDAGGSGAQNDKTGSAGKAKTVTRTQFEALSQAERMKASKEGVQVVD
jgi:hypothetical protein